MALTLEQKQTIKAWLDVNAVNVQDEEAAALLNAPASPAFVVWRTNVGENEILNTPDFNFTQVDNLSVGKARIWDWMFRDGSIDPSKANIRAGIAAAWMGTVAATNVQAVVLAACKRNATVAEKLLATGTGTTENPAIMGFEGLLTYQDISEARNS